MTHQKIRKKFKDFFEKRNHKWVESSSLLPTDPSVLFTTAGMQQFKPYYTGEADAMKDFGSLNTVSIQKSMRTSDIDEVGDESHLTFFEMLGNFSFGGYWKEASITWAYEFITKELGLKVDYVSVFSGSEGMPADEESELIWKEIAKNNNVAIEVKKMGIEDNTWGPTGNEGPCGPTTEIYVDGVEIWNIVFNEFYYKGNREQMLKETDPSKFKHLKPAGIDTGMGLERLAMVVQGVKNIFETDLLEPIIKLAPSELDIRAKRIIADHSRAIAFLITDGVRPSNKEQGYVLRRLMRRVITYFYTATQSTPPVDKRLAKSFIHRSDLSLMHDIFAKILEIYGQYYPELNADLIIHEFDREKEKFEKTLSQGLKELGKMPSVNAENAFKLYESYGLPFEVIKELGKEKTTELSRENFDEEFRKHQEISRAGAEKKFGGHGMITEGDLTAANAEEMKKKTRLHTATHLLHAALRKILGEEVKQQGSDITPERLRFDFTFPRKLTLEELKQVEDMVNDAVKKELPVTKTEMSYEDAIKSGALAFFKEKYPDRVTVYTIGPKTTDNSINGSTDKAVEPFNRELSNSTSSGQFFSKELCGGPHVSNTAEIGKFKITKEESVSAGIRRIRATVE
ncbi:MAG: alanine--tRNA ligase [Candidatus Yanofskybacteria bacterium]|nr:alanine--tRNA ligase [Candidatus Yanofskybacteria bacterium]